MADDRNAAGLSETMSRLVHQYLLISRNLRSTFPSMISVEQLHQFKRELSVVSVGAKEISHTTCFNIFPLGVLSSLFFRCDHVVIGILLLVLLCWLIAIPDFR